MSKLSKAADTTIEGLIPCVVYAAKSSPDENGSVEDQAARVVAAVAAEGGRELVAEPFTEENESAFHGSRGPQLEAALAAAVEAARDGSAELWVFHSSRLARGSGKREEARSLLRIYVDALGAGVGLRSVEDDGYLANGLMVAVASEQNHKYSADLSAHVRRGKQRQFERGERLGGPVPDGYLLLKHFDEHHTYKPDSDRAPLMRRMFELSEGGMGDPSIARTLNAEGYRTRGRGGKPGIPWTRRRVQDALTNPFYAGRVALHRNTPDEEVRDGRHPALIEPARFDAIRKLRGTRDRAAGSDRSARGRPVSTYALARMAVCGRCGSTMHPRTSTYRRKDGTKRRSYLCAHVHGGTGLCDAPVISAEQVEPAVIARLDELLIDFEAWQAGVTAGHEHEQRNMGREMERAETAHERAVGAVQRTQTRWQEHEAAGAVEEAAAVLRMLVKAERAEEQEAQRLAAARDALASLPQAPAANDAMLDFYSALRAAVRGRLEGADSLLKVNDALRDLFDRFVLDSTDAGVTVLPILSRATAERILSDAKMWADHADVLIAGQAARPVKHPDGPAFVVDVTTVEQGEQLERIVRGEEEVEIAARLRQPDAITATGREPIVPPLRPFTAGPETPASEKANAQAYLWMNPNRRALEWRRPAPRREPRAPLPASRGGDRRPRGG